MCGRNCRLRCSLLDLGSWRRSWGIGGALYRCRVRFGGGGVFVRRLLGLLGSIAVLG